MAIDLNTVAEEEGEEEEAKKRSAACIGTVCFDLWHAYAGPLVFLPRKGSFVVYLPQAHMEVAGNGSGVMMDCDLPPHVVCRVVDVLLKAEDLTDVVYAQLSLVAVSADDMKLFQEGNVDREGEELNEMNSGGDSPRPRIFCKNLTASDTSTHGGFSVPRRAAEYCFPPLDYYQQRPSQELVVKDLHGVEWTFRHIYRGNPLRHLLTSGWSNFVKKKKLVTGDAVLFLRGDDGELRLGIRRTSQLKGKILRQIHSSQCLKLGVSTLSSLANLVSTGKIFQVNYNPRVNQSEFIIPYLTFIKSYDYSFSVGSRFKMHFERDDAANRRCSGLITGVSDLDPIRWPGSKWKCFVVRWDGEDFVDCGRSNRVSPWEIEPSRSLSGSTNLCPPISKRARIGGSGYSDLGESARLNKVLQGQEILGFKTSDVKNATVFRTSDTRNHLFHEMKSCFPNPESSLLADSGSFIRVPDGNSGFFNQGMGLAESARFLEVLQGQEIVPLNQTYPSIYVQNHEENSSNVIESSDTNCAIMLPCAASTQASSPSSDLTFQQSLSQLLFAPSYYGINEHERAEDCAMSGTFSSVDSSSQSHQPGNCISRDHCESRLNFTKTLKKNDSTHRSSGSGFTLFGFPL